MRRWIIIASGLSAILVCVSGALLVWFFWGQQILIDGKPWFLFLSSQPSILYQAEEDPEAGAYNYVLALIRKDYDRAVGYLSESLPQYPGTVEKFLEDLAQDDLLPADQMAPCVYVEGVEEYGREHRFVEPVSVVDGLAVYAAGSGEPVLVFPDPHGHTMEPMAQGPIADILVDMERAVVTFDVPGAYRSTREPVGDMDEMIRSADETLDRLGIQGPVDGVGHSMGGLAAFAYAMERPERTRRLVLVTSLSGFPAAARWGFPGSAFRFYEADYWRLIVWGIRFNAGRGDLALHKRLQNLMERASYHDKTLFTPVEIDADDDEKGVPIRTLWSKNMYSRLSYADRLEQVRASTLILAGRQDPEAPLLCSEELVQGIPRANLVIFEERAFSLH